MCSLWAEVRWCYHWSNYDTMLVRRTLDRYTRYAQTLIVITVSDLDQVLTCGNVKVNKTKFVALSNMKYIYLHIVKLREREGQGVYYCIADWSFSAFWNKQIEILNPVCEEQVGLTLGWSSVMLALCLLKDSKPNFISMCQVLHSSIASRRFQLFYNSLIHHR